MCRRWNGSPSPGSRRRGDRAGDAVHVRALCSDVDRRRSGVHLQLRVHVLRALRRGSGPQVSELRRRTRRSPSPQAVTRPDAVVTLHSYRGRRILALTTCRCVARRRGRFAGGHDTSVSGGSPSCEADGSCGTQAGGRRVPKDRPCISATALPAPVPASPLRAGNGSGQPCGKNLPRERRSRMRHVRPVECTSRDGATALTGENWLRGPSLVGVSTEDG